MGLKEKMMNGMMDKMSADERKEIMNEMMENFFSKMSKEEKQSMMNGMMEKFFSNMPDEEKQNMMKNMMPGMMGVNKGSFMGGMMDMMGKMMSGGKEGENSREMPWDMCKKMMGSITKTADLAAFATPEIKQLFEDWIQQIDEEILAFIKKSDAIDIEKIMDNFKLSKDSVVYFLTRLAQKGKIKFDK